LWPLNARIGYMDWMGDRDPPYSEGYRMAARQLAAGVREKGHRGDPHYLVYPIVFFYRHHVELVLKRLMMMNADLGGEELDHKCSKDLGNHRLDQLWADVKGLLKNTKTFTIKIDSEDREGIDSYIQQFADIDPNSQDFRYTRNNKGARSLPEGLDYINIAVLSDHMERLCSFLDGLDSYIDHMLEIRNDMRAEMYSDTQADYMDYADGY
jgi:hypothetical protein